MVKLKAAARNSSWIITSLNLYGRSQGNPHTYKQFIFILHAPEHKSCATAIMAKDEDKERGIGKTKIHVQFFHSPSPRYRLSIGIHGPSIG